MYFILDIQRQSSDNTIGSLRINLLENSLKDVQSKLNTKQFNLISLYLEDKYKVSLSGQAHVNLSGDIQKHVARPRDKRYCIYYVIRNKIKKK